MKVVLKQTVAKQVTWLQGIVKIVSYKCIVCMLVCFNLFVAFYVGLTVIFIWSVFCIVQITMTQPAMWDTRPTCTYGPVLSGVGITLFGKGFICGKRVPFTAKESSIQVKYTIQSLSFLLSHPLCSPSQQAQRPVTHNCSLAFSSARWASDQSHPTILTIHPQSSLPVFVIPTK